MPFPSPETLRSRKELTFKVRRTQCETCIYRKDSPLDLAKLENQVKDEHGCFTSFRACHHHGTGEETVCCRGFWNRHRDAVTVTRLAEVLGLVVFTNTNDRFADDWSAQAEHRNLAAKHKENPND